MRTRFAFILFLTLFLGSSVFLRAQKNALACSDLPVLIGLLEKYHISPLQFSDSVTSDIKMELCKALDAEYLLFTRADLEEIFDQPLNLNKPASADNCEFIKFIIGLYNRKLQYTDSIIPLLKIDFTVADSISFYKKYLQNLAKDNAELNKEWVRWIKYKSLYKTFGSTEAGNPDSLPKNTVDIATIEKVRNREARRIEGLLDYSGGVDAFVTATFFNAIANRFDPHSEFFKPSEMNEFENALSTQSYIFGFSIEENANGDIIIKHLLPGSAAWKSNELHDGDKLLQIKYPGQQAIDLSEAGIEEANSAIASSTADQVTLTVKKTNGLVKTFNLKKESIAVNENLIKSYILNGSNAVGYISLPDFYTDIDNSTRQGCANDMAKEIIKLKHENIDGLIVDLRYNGGGSIEEALGLAGIFIDIGPLCVIKEKDTTPITLKDYNRGVIYDGPLIVLINALSASASELVASALQDYNRALIVGTNSFGKATGQTVVPLDASFADNKIKPANFKSQKGYLKVTNLRLYRITCKSNQLVGIVPDIILPGFLGETNYHESLYPYALSKDSVFKKTYYKPLPALPINTLAEKSSARIKSDTCFNKIIELTDSIKKAKKNNLVIPLNYTKYKQYYDNQTFFTNFTDSLFIRRSSLFIVANNGVDKEILSMDKNRRSINEMYMQYISNDIYLDETYKIMIDLIKTKP
jgi:carboxyl-terminal processing protease